MMPVTSKLSCSVHGTEATKLTSAFFIEVINNLVVPGYYFSDLSLEGLTVSTSVWSLYL